jgi:hypothetical protein
MLGKLNFQNFKLVIIIPRSTIKTNHNPPIINYPPSISELSGDENEDSWDGEVDAEGNPIGKKTLEDNTKKFSKLSLSSLANLLGKSKKKKEPKPKPPATLAVVAGRIFELRW